MRARFTSDHRKARQNLTNTCINIKQSTLLLVEMTNRHFKELLSSYGISNNDRLRFDRSMAGYSCPPVNLFPLCFHILYVCNFGKQYMMRCIVCIVCGYCTFTVVFFFFCLFCSANSFVMKLKTEQWSSGYKSKIQMQQHCGEKNLCVQNQLNYYYEAIVLLALLKFCFLILAMPYAFSPCNSFRNCIESGFAIQRWHQPMKASFRWLFLF